MYFLNEVSREFSWIYFSVITLGSFLLHLILAIGVYQEASDRSMRGHKLWFFGEVFWALATLTGGVFTAAAYWVMHHSTLNSADSVDPDDN